MLTEQEEGKVRNIIDAFDNGKSVTELNAATTLGNNDVMEVLQEGENKKVPVSVVKESVNSDVLKDLNKRGVFNVTVSVPLSAGTYYTLSTAIAAVPTASKSLGLDLKFSTAANTWVVYRYKGSDLTGWATTTNWEQVPDASQIAQVRADLNESIMEETAYQLNGSVINGKYILSNGDLGNLGAYDVITYPITTGDVLELICTYNIGVSKKYAIYNSLTVFNSTTVLKIGGTVSSSYDDIINVDVVGDNLTFVAVKYISSGAVTLKKIVQENKIDKILQSIEYFQKPIAYDINDNIINVAFKYGLNQDLKIRLRPRGGNGLFDFSNISIFNNSDIKINNDFNLYTTLQEIGSDCHAPFKVKAVNNIDGDNKDGSVYRDYFTGGNHQYNNQSSGSTPTARLSFVRFFSNGKEIFEGSGYSNYIEIRWENYVQGNNTTKIDGSGREILKERHNLKFDGIRWTSEVELIPLEDIIIYNWYGFALTYSQIYNQTFNFKDAANRVVYNSISAQKCGSKMCSSIRLSGLYHTIEMGVDENFDLGKRNMISNNGCFVESYGKAYHKIIELENNFYVGSRYYLRGYYMFYPI